MIVINLNIILVTLAIVLICIALAKELKNPYIAIGLLIFSVILLINSCLSIDLVPKESRYEVYMSIAVEFFLILMCYITYLWIDDLNARRLNLKSYDDSLVWMWNETPRINNKNNSIDNSKSNSDKRENQENILKKNKK